MKKCVSIFSAKDTNKNNSIKNKICPSRMSHIRTKLLAGLKIKSDKINVQCVKDDFSS